nr:MAG TPA: hypothetical protein [Caudoviricetes sp.]
MRGFGLFTLAACVLLFSPPKKIFGNLQKTLDIPVSVCYTRGE